MPSSETIERPFSITVLGRTLEHLGVQMYKRRDVAIAELVANSWDANAHRVWINIPSDSDYNPEKSTIIVADDGIGMTDDQVQEQYLVVGRNRRQTGGLSPEGRLVMGRKGIGKLAGFGVASKMSILTWRDEMATSLEMDVRELTKNDGVAGEIAIAGLVGPASSNLITSSGTRISLSNLKQKTPLSIDVVREALGRRFSRTVRGEMQIFVNDEEVAEPYVDFEMRVPEEGFEEAKLSDGSVVRYYYGFAKDVIRSAQMRGFTIYVNGKTAQAPPFYFFVEGTASGQHGTKYLSGAIDADFLDQGTDNESDRISTDRQEIDWEDEHVQPLLKWGDALTRKALRERSNRKGDEMEKRVEENTPLHTRVERLDEISRKQVRGFLRDLGQAEPDPARSLALADAIVSAYEYRHFHDVIGQIEAASENPDQLNSLLSHLVDWQVLESKAILEIIKGRLDIIDKLQQMVIDNAPETAHRTGDDNLHDLLAGSPWILNPEYQVLAEEKSLSKQLKDWNSQEVTNDPAMRYDFLALANEARLVIVEIKRSGHTVELKELQRLETYKENLRRARSNVYMMMICSGSLEGSPELAQYWHNRPDGEIVPWEDVCKKTRTYYEHYRAVLEGEVEHKDFSGKERELARTREVLSRGTVFRGKEGRIKGIGAQDVNYE